MKVVVDTNVLVSALRSHGGASRAVVRAAIEGRITPVFGNALWSEYLDVIERPVLSGTTADERSTVIAALAAKARWVSIYFTWRPNLPDEGDNHLIELAIASGAASIITHNLRDFRGGELKWPRLLIVTPAQFLENLP